MSLNKKIIDEIKKDIEWAEKEIRKLELFKWRKKVELADLLKGE